MVIWLSPDYRQRYGIDMHCLNKQAATLDYSQDNLFSTMLGLTGTQTHEYVPGDDILSACRSSK